MPIFSTDTTAEVQQKERLLFTFSCFAIAHNTFLFCFFITA